MVGGGAVVTRWICYGTEKLKKDIIRSKLESLFPWDLVFFAAPSAVEAFCGVWEDKSGFTAVAIGPTTGEALRNRNFKNIITSNGTSIDDCAETILKALKEQVRG
jgi:uroporphyrinogen-III synthase